MPFKIAFMIAAALSVATAVAADAPKHAGGVDHWRAAELKSHGESLHQKIAAPGNMAFDALAKYGSGSTMLARREGNGVVEVHAEFEDYFVVQSGSATLVVGGEVVNPKTADPGETRGDSIKGGERITLGVGDVVHIPATVPHQLFIDAGKQFTYFVIKVKAG